MNDNLENRILAFLEASPNEAYNISEISRAIGRAPPTTSKLIEKLQREKKITVVNKKSMKLITLVKKC